MKITRIYTGEDKKSHFEDVTLELFDAEFGKITAPIETQSILFGDIHDLDEIPWHNPPCRQFVIILEGKIEIEIGDGTKRLFNTGDIVLAEDLTGQGHVTRLVNKIGRRYLVVPLK